MTSRLLLIALSALLGISERANAGVMLFVDFGDSTSSPTTKEDLHSTFVPRTGTGDYLLTANYYLQLTGGSSIYSYQFSVRFDENLTLLFDDVDQTRPAPLLAKPSVQIQMTGSYELNGLNGADGSTFDRKKYPDELSLMGDGFYKLATTTFIVKGGATFTPGADLVTPGQFEINPNANTNDLRFLDVFLADGVEPFFPMVTSGTVANSSVPEPISCLVFGTLGILAVVLGKRRVATENAKV